VNATIPRGVSKRRFPCRSSDHGAHAEVLQRTAGTQQGCFTGS